MKKIICLLLALLFFIVVFSGCTGDISEPIQNDTDTNVTEKTTLHNETVPEGYIGIYTVEDFDYLRNSSTGQYILMNDIDMSNIDDWDGINFQGTFNGNNYEIQNYHFENGVYVFWMPTKIYAQSVSTFSFWMLCSLWHKGLRGVKMCVFSRKTIAVKHL